MDLFEAEQRIIRLESFFNEDNPLSVMNRFVLIEKKLKEIEEEIKTRPTVNEV
ncbi:MAG: hypothetical protein BWY04_01044 [candidate division CPR1 bacterium ADurb.Bin160]|jgi:hypothetical protein|uniref:Uncharacterized protein n=1 Tax=candidate division CPR1 bacterium ADurb.Bin160 TaxID=1852826 RepID=A0A1V5ZLS3_9BACT|nr:MAG: hypothetical protein BWY04_01044 [candidate division CPR1 bacterium ADurb.Bin160]